MLVLSRKVGEQVLIPQLNITVTVLSSGPGRVQLGITAPKEIDITRPEYLSRQMATTLMDVLTTEHVDSFAEFPGQPAMC